MNGEAQRVGGEAHPDPETPLAAAIVARIVARFGCSSEAELMELINLGRAVQEVEPFIPFLPDSPYAKGWNACLAALRGSALSVAPEEPTPCKTCGGTGYPPFDPTVATADIWKRCPDCAADRAPEEPQADAATRRLIAIGELVDGARYRTNDQFGGRRVLVGLSAEGRTGIYDDDAQRIIEWLRATVAVRAPEAPQ